MRQAARTLSALPLLALAGAGCIRGYATLPPAQVCASDATLGRIKDAVFQQATTQASSQTRYALEQLKPQVKAELDRPLVESFDRDTRKTTCTGSLDMWLPPGVAGPRELQGPIRYDAQPTADGRDVAFEVSGEETLASRIAGADLSAWADAHAPRKPGLVVEVVPRGPAMSAQADAPAAPAAPAPMRVSAPPPKLAVAAPAVPGPAPAPAPAPTPAPAAEPRVASLPADRSVGGPVRVFVHVAGPAELPLANQVRAEVARVWVGGAPVAAPPARLVAATPRRMEVRCLKRADCRAAREVAADLSGPLGGPITVVDMSATYGDDPGVRPGSLELWLPDRRSPLDERPDDDAPDPGEPPPPNF